MDQTNPLFCGGKYSILDPFCSPEFVFCYTFIYKSKEVAENDIYQPDVLLDRLTEGNHNQNYQVDEFQR